MKKVIILILTLALCFNMVTPVFAAEAGVNTIKSDDVTVTTQNLPNNQYMVKVEYADHYEIAIRDNETYQIVTRVYDPDGNTIDEFYTDASIMLHLEDILQTNDYYEHTFSDYEYDVDTSGVYDLWTCRRRSDSKIRAYIPDSATAERLDQWEYFVGEINKLEFELIGAFGWTVAEVIVTQLLTGGLATAVAYLQGSTDMLFVIMDLESMYGEADEVFDEL